MPHSDIPGSKPARSSPRLNAACHVLHRLHMPRHPPDALKSLEITTMHRDQAIKPDPRHTAANSYIRHCPKTASSQSRLQATHKPFTMSKNQMSGVSYQTTTPASKPFSLYFKIIFLSASDAEVFCWPQSPARTSVRLAYGQKWPTRSRAYKPCGLEPRPRHRSF